MSFQPSKYQQEIYRWVKDGYGSAIINAVAGSGKTTTIVKAVQLIPEDQSIAFFAFNKAIALEIGKKVPEGVFTSTIHSYGYQCWKKHIQRISLANNEILNPKEKPDQYKIKKLINENLTKEAKFLYGREIEELIGKARADGISPNINNLSPIIEDTFDNWVELINKYGIDINPLHLKQAVECAQRILRLSLDKVWPVDFDEMLYLPAISEIDPFKKFDWVFVDEAQDLSAVQRILIEKAMKPNARLVAVGDPFQAIYGFRGASSNSMSLIQEHFKCEELKLSICYRCCLSVIRKAQAIVPHIEGSESAEEGEVVSNCKVVSLETLDENAMIICRNNAPLVKIALELLKLNHPLNVQLGGFDSELLSVVRSLSDDVNSNVGLIEKLTIEMDNRIKEALESNLVQIVEKIQDQFDSLVNIAKATNSKSKQDLIISINDLVKNESGVTLCSIHKSKGLEKESVFIVDIALLPSKYATLEWQKDQERNLLYVAYTRAKSKLVMIDSNTVSFGRNLVEVPIEEYKPKTRSNKNFSIKKISNNDQEYARSDELPPHQKRNILNRIISKLLGY